MKNIYQIASGSLCLSAAVMLTACGSEGSNHATKVQTVNQMTEAAAPAMPVEAAAIDQKAVAAAVDPQHGAAESFSAEADPHAHHAHARGDQPVHSNAPVVLIPEPAEVELGDVATMDTAKGFIKLVNTADYPVTITGSRPSCGCTTLKPINNLVVGPKESTEIEVQMSTPNKAGRVSGKIVTFTVENHPPVTVRLAANAIAYVEMEPAILVAEDSGTAIVRLRAIDGTPFRIRSIQPAMISELPQEALAEHEIEFRWEDFHAAALTPKATIHLDHPKCSQIWMETRMTPAQMEAINQKRRAGALARPGVTPTGPAVPTDALVPTMIKDRRNEAVLERIKSGMDVNHRDSTGANLLALAAGSGNNALLRELLAQKADVENIDNAGGTPLIAAAKGRNSEGVRILLDAGASITARDNIGNTVLGWASAFCDADTVRELIDAGGDVHAADAVLGWTPLIWASSLGDPKSVAYLLEAKANIEHADNTEGATPLINAVRTGKVEAIKLLLQHGAAIEGADRNGLTPLLAAAKNAGGTVEKLQVLIDGGANLQARDHRGQNALELARKRTDRGAQEAVEFLQELIGE